MIRSLHCLFVTLRRNRYFSNQYPNPTCLYLPPRLQIQEVTVDIMMETQQTNKCSKVTAQINTASNSKPRKHCHSRSNSTGATIERIRKGHIYTSIGFRVMSDDCPRASLDLACVLRIKTIKGHIFLVSTPFHITSNRLIYINANGPNILLPCKKVFVSCIGIMRSSTDSPKRSSHRLDSGL